MGQRIVINLDAPRTEGAKPARKRRRWPRVLGILALLVLFVVVIAGVGGFFWWRHYQSTPAYTLTLLVDAAQRNDAAEFQKRINDDEIAKNMVATVTEKASTRYGGALDSTTRQRIDSVMPSLLPQLKQRIHDEVVKEIQTFAAKSEPRPFVVLLVTVPSLVTVTSQGDTANVKAPLPDRTIEMTMQRDADRWKITDFKDDVVVQRVVDSVMKELPAIGAADAVNQFLEKSQRRRARRQR